MNPKPGEIYLVDLGMVAKVRPAVVVSRADPDSPRALSILVPLTTENRGSAYEVSLGKLRFLNKDSWVSQRMREFNQQYVRELLKAERMALVGRFASSIVHDLKNPLTIIGIGAEMACLETSTAESRKTAEQRIRRQIERISGMVNDILEFTRGGTSRVVLASVDYAAFVRSVIEDLDREMARKSITIEFAGEPPSAKLQINPQRLNRVFYNLVLNAADEMPGGGRIKLRFAVNDAEVVTEVADTGGGIAPEIIDTLFEPFATHGKSKGTGLGLSISKRTIEDHGGRIWARNDPAGGAVFGFSLPRRDA